MRPIYKILIPIAVLIAIVFLWFYFWPGLFLRLYLNYKCPAASVPLQAKEVASNLPDREGFMGLEFAGHNFMFPKVDDSKIDRKDHSVSIKLTDGGKGMLLIDRADEKDFSESFKQNSTAAEYLMKESFGTDKLDEYALKQRIFNLKADNIGMWDKKDKVWSDVTFLLTKQLLHGDSKASYYFENDTFKGFHYKSENDNDIIDLYFSDGKKMDLVISPVLAQEDVDYILSKTK